MARLQGKKGYLATAILCLTGLTVELVEYTIRWADEGGRAFALC